VVGRHWLELLWNYPKTKRSRVVCARVLVLCVVLIYLYTVCNRYDICGI
jgi:hypothetical protein